MAGSIALMNFTDRIPLNCPLKSCMLSFSPFLKSFLMLITDQHATHSESIKAVMDK